jgi:hypothetical protein
VWIASSRQTATSGKILLFRITRSLRNSLSTLAISAVRSGESKSASAMSALGQKQTSRHLQSMSALPPKADIGTQSWNVRFVRIADISAAARHVRSGSDFRFNSESRHLLTDPARAEQISTDLFHLPSSIVNCDYPTWAFGDFL